MKPRISLIIPAHNEAAFITGCLEAARDAALGLDAGVETIVVLNRCTDATEEIARAHGCVIVREDAKNLSVIRNAGAAAATGEIIVTCDADSRMHPESFREILRILCAGKTVGGGAMVLPERWSPGIIASAVSILPYLAFTGVSFGMFWCHKRDFDKIGGFDTRFVSVEDVDFARRLKAHGRKSGLGWGTLWRAPLVTSCRKFDQFGDWYLFRNPAFVRKVFRGNDRQVADKFWYDVRSE
ncbi:glycosyltransferase [Luteolibacter yonseiensis]|uniref:Glycosyltransferase n=1 Tax=Luteolibacter yonseiensis TaxID=1144680 RepID=A0A934R132_9BACT|nr:glycosyltransferase [Luteolibacter yonseiensis]MBK1816438.1 glycosyltransferase [Luteolibacter yonseiensis]